MGVLTGWQGRFFEVYRNRAELSDGEGFAA